MLTQLGYAPGDIDAVVGPETQAALTRFQELEGLRPTGMTNRATMQALRAAVDQSGVAVAAAPPAPVAEAESASTAAPRPAATPQRNRNFITGSVGAEMSGGEGGGGGGSW